MIIGCWCCFGAYCWWIDTMGIPIFELVMRIVVVVENLWKFGELLNFDEMMFNVKFYASLSVFSCIWPVNIFGASFGYLKDRDLGFWVKRVWNPKLFGRTDERSLKRAPSEQAQWVLDTGRLSEPQGSFKRASPEATGSWSLKRAAPCSAIIHFSFRTLGANPNFLKCFFWLS